MNKLLNSINVHRLYHLLTNYVTSCLCLYNTIAHWIWLKFAAETCRSEKLRLFSSGNKEVCIKQLNDVDNIKSSFLWFQSLHWPSTTTFVRIIRSSQLMNTHLCREWNKFALYTVLPSRYIVWKIFCIHIHCTIELHSTSGQFNSLNFTSVIYTSLRFSYLDFTSLPI